MTVYADVLVALNILLTYILLVACRVMCKIPTNKWAVAVASFIGGFSSLIIFYDSAGTAFSFLYKLITGGIIVAIGFLPKSLKIFIKTFLAFFGVSFFFGGAMYALEITVNPENIMYVNGTVYFNMSITYLVGCVLVIYGVFLLADFLINRRALKNSKCIVEITHNFTTVTLPGLIDTGNSLTDGVSGRPVIVAELSALSPLFTREENLFFKKGDYENVPENLRKIIRLIPCKAVTGESLLLSFIPTEIKVKTDKETYTTSFCAVAVTDGELSQGEYKALLNNNIFVNGREEKNNEKSYI